MKDKPNKYLDNKSLDNPPEPVLTLQQNQSLTGRMYGLRQAALSLAAQCEQIIEYLRRNS